MWVCGCKPSTALTRACAACIYIWACSIQHSWLPVFLFMNKKKILRRSTQHQNRLSPDYDHRRSMLWQLATAWLSIWRTWRKMIKMIKKKMPEKTDKKLCLKKVLTALKRGKSSEHDSVCPQKPDIWRLLLCSFTFIIRIAQSWSACIWCDTVLLPYCSRDLGLRDVLPKGSHSHYINVSWHLP